MTLMNCTHISIYKAYLESNAIIDFVCINEHTQGYVRFRYEIPLRYIFFYLELNTIKEKGK